ncbi:MAG: pyridoxamine 5'-phosphate oxidase family protein [Candidatus Omnitrophota bacterium]
MKRLSENIIQFFQNQGFVVVSTIDREGIPHSSCKGIVNIDSRGLIYLLDLYRAKTYENLKRNPRISITAVDEHKFIGYCLKGRARIIASSKLKPRIIRAWESRLTSRITRRIIKNVQGEKGHARHPEALLPKPAYLVVMEIEEVVDLTPLPLK